MLSDKHSIPAPDDYHGGGGIPEVVPPLPRENQHARGLPWTTANGWLARGWTDTWTHPMSSLLYGFVVFLISASFVWFLFEQELDYVLFPALAGFMVVGPLVANGLYEKSRRLEDNQSVTFSAMIAVKPASGYQTILMGVLLVGLFMLWMRAAVLLYALFFGVVAFPGTGDLLPMLLGTVEGWALLFVGGIVGALFAAFAFSISVFAVPMMLKERTDALSAMGISMAMVWSNLPVMLAWGLTVLMLFVLSVATAFVGLIVVFPILGHATWHAYRSIRGDIRVGGKTERMFVQPI